MENTISAQVRSGPVFIKILILRVFRRILISEINNFPVHKDSYS